MAQINKIFRADLIRPGDSEVFPEPVLDADIATQIKILREQHDLTQVQLAQLIGTHQTVISRIENINYSSWNIGTLKKLARVFGVRLKVAFERPRSLSDNAEKSGGTSLHAVKGQTAAHFCDDCLRLSESLAEHATMLADRASLVAKLAGTVNTVEFHAQTVEMRRIQRECEHLRAQFEAHRSKLALKQPDAHAP